MNTSLKLVALGLLLGVVTAATAQDGPPPREGGRGPGGPEGGPGGPRPLPPLLAVLDANQDGVIDAQEIARASEALKKLDKDGDGKLSREECLGPRPQRPGGMGGPGGPGGPGEFGGPRGPRGPQDGSLPPRGPGGPGGPGGQGPRPPRPPTE